MEAKLLSEIARVPPHSHPGFEVTLQPLLGRAVLPAEGGDEIVLEPGRLYFADGSRSFNPRNPYRRALPDADSSRQEMRSSTD